MIDLDQKKKMIQGKSSGKKNVDIIGHTSTTNIIGHTSTTKRIFPGASLISAIEHKDFDLIFKLLEDNININLLDNQGWGALHYAVQQNLKDIVKILIAKGIKVNKTTKRGLTSLHIATWLNNLEIIKIIIESTAADVNLIDEKGISVLMLASWLENEKCVELFINEGANVKQFSDEGLQAIHYAFMVGNINCVNLLLKNGANLNQPTKDGKLPISFAKENNKFNLIQYFFPEDFEQIGQEYSKKIDAQDRLFQFTQYNKIIEDQQLSDKKSKHSTNHSNEEENQIISYSKEEEPIEDTLLTYTDNHFTTDNSSELTTSIKEEYKKQKDIETVKNLEDDSKSSKLNGDFKYSNLEKGKLNVLNNFTSNNQNNDIGTQTIIANYGLKTSDIPTVHNEYSTTSSNNLNEDNSNKNKNKLHSSQNLLAKHHSIKNSYIDDDLIGFNDVKINQQDSKIKTENFFNNLISDQDLDDEFDNQILEEDEIENLLEKNKQNILNKYQDTQNTINQTQDLLKVSTQENEKIEDIDDKKIMQEQQNNKQNVVETLKNIKENSKEDLIADEDRNIELNPINSSLNDDNFSQSLQLMNNYLSGYSKDNNFPIQNSKKVIDKILNPSVIKENNNDIDEKIIQSRQTFQFKSLSQEFKTISLKSKDTNQEYREDKDQNEKNNLILKEYGRDSNQKNYFISTQNKIFFRIDEMIIANVLESLDLEYIYRREITGTVKPGVAIPTFTFIDQNNELIIWEHLHYNPFEKDNLKLWNEKNLWYQNNGFNYFINFFMTYADIDLMSGFNSQNIKNIALSIKAKI